ncbi:hypothetical protein M405DRAFT_778256, partial [Rhizopogon salebrosus TDB-379]
MRTQNRSLARASSHPMPTWRILNQLSLDSSRGMSNFILKALWLNILHRNAVLRRVFDYPIPGV